MIWVKLPGIAPFCGISKPAAIIGHIGVMQVGTMNNLSRRAIFITAGLLIAVVIAGTAVALWLYRSAALASGEWHLKNVALALAEHASQSMLTIDNALRATADDYGRDVAAGTFSEAAFHAVIHQRASRLPQLTSLLVTGPDGSIAAHSQVYPVPPSRIEDWDYFRVQLRVAHDGGLFFGVPVKGVSDAWLHPMSRRVSDPAGRFLGVAVAAINASYFQDIYRSVELGPAGHVFLFRADGVLLTSFPRREGVFGQSFGHHAIFDRLKAAPTGVISTQGVLDAEERLIGYHRVTDYPLVVAVSSPVRYVLREWREQSVYAAASALAAIIVILGGALLLARQVRLAQELAGEVAESEYRWLSAMEAAGHGVWEWDVVTGRIFRSREYHRMLGYEEGELGEGRERWFELVHPEDRSIAQATNRACLEGRANNFSNELRLRCKDGSWKWVLNRGIVVNRDTRGGALRVLGTLTDVTETHEAQQQLRENAARLNAIVESAMDAIVTIDEDHTIVLFNKAAEKVFRCPARGAPGEEAIGSKLDRFIPERYRAAHRAHIERFGRTGTTMRRMGENIVLAGLRGDGEEFPIDASISQVQVGGRRYFTVILRDITERKRASDALQASHRELRELYGVMNEVREAERIRIARELHDELAQWLTALKMDVSWIAARLPGDLPRLLDKTARMKEVVDTMVAAVRRIAADLRPVMIDDLGLIPAIEHLLHEFSQRTAILVSLDTSIETVELHDPVATAVYRMVQEALTNVARHAEATRVEVSLAIEAESLVVKVRDNGRGIDEGSLRKGKSYGVLGIRERAQTLGGSARIYRAESGGTTVEIAIPLRAQARMESAA